MSSRKETLELYLLPPGPCPYISGQTEQKLATLLDVTNAHLAPLLAERGFRRTQRMFYRQQCPACRACIATRIKLDGFAPNEAFRRNLRKNAALTADFSRPAATAENYAMFIRYLEARHGDGDMTKMSFADFRGMMEDDAPGASVARFLTCRDGDKVLGIMLFDELPDGTSAVYSFFEPSAEKRSLGSWMVLKLAEYTRQTGRPYLYLGFWVKQSPKMSYKARFQPLELFVDEEWIDFKDQA